MDMSRVQCGRMELFPHTSAFASGVATWCSASVYSRRVVSTIARLPHRSLSFSSLPARSESPLSPPCHSLSSQPSPHTLAFFWLSLHTSDISASLSYRMRKNYRFLFHILYRASTAVFYPDYRALNNANSAAVFQALPHLEESFVIILKTNTNF